MEEESGRKLGDASNFLRRVVRDTVLLALKMEEGAHSQGMPLELENVKKQIFPLEYPERKTLTLTT